VPARPIRTLHLDDLVLLVAKCLSGFTHFVILGQSTELHSVLKDIWFYAVLVGGSNEDGAWRGLVTIFELIDPRPYKNQSPVYRRLICTVIYMSDRLLTEANPNPHLPPPPELRSLVVLRP
jgi:hypothetical protein